MTAERPVPTTQGNDLLARLPPQELQRLVPHLSRISVRLQQVLYDFHAWIDYAYFPLQSILSAVTVMRDGRAIEIGSIGREGAAGLSVLTGERKSPSRMIGQAPGSSLRIRADVLQKLAADEGPLRALLLKYQTCFFVQVSQSVACNGLHSIQQRCCRWLLMTRDRIDCDDLALTHEFLATMLGVRRAGITEVLRSLQEQELLRCSRGQVTLLDRKGLESLACECYQFIKNEYKTLLE